MVATLALTNCAKEINPAQTPESAGIPFEITASSVDTKTSLDGLQTVWVEGDALNVFHAEKGTTVYENDNKFTYTSDNKFIGTLSQELTADEYDWYALYPYSSYVKTPANTSTGYIPVGTISAEQSGNDNMSHLSGTNFPMYGKATVTNGSPVSVSMHHLVSVIEVDVTNMLADPLTVNKIEFTGTEDIAGTYYVDFSDENVKYKSSGDAYVSSKVTLFVEDGTPIAKDQSSKFYIGIKPFAASSGSLKLSVNGQEKVISISEEVVFAPGEIKTLKFKYNPEVVLPAATLSFANKEQRVEYSTSEQVWEQNGVRLTNVKASSTNNVGDYSNPVRLYKGSKATIEMIDGQKMTKIVFVGAGESKHKAAIGESLDAAGVAYTVSNGEYTVELDNVESLTFSLANQARFSSLTVTYIEE